MLVDYDFEERLHQRITVREAARRLTARQRRFLYRYFQRGETYLEIGEHEGLSGTRVVQILDTAVRHLRARVTKVSGAVAIEARRTTGNTPPVGFDKAAFLKHMRGLIRRREEERAYAKATAWQREMAAMAEFVDMATPPPPRPPPPLYEPPRIVLPTYVPPPPPIPAGDLAQEALHSFMGHRLPAEHGRYTVGEQCSTVRFAVSGRPTPDEIDEAMRRLAEEIPADAVLSVMPIGGDVGQTLATVRNAHVAVQALVMAHNAYSGVATYRLAITWDFAPDAH